MRLRLRCGCRRTDSELFLFIYLFLFLSLSLSSLPSLQFYLVAIFLYEIKGLKRRHRSDRCRNAAECKCAQDWLFLTAWDAERFPHGGRRKA